jgi:hypothetical protein
MGEFGIGQPVQREEDPFSSEQEDPSPAKEKAADNRTERPAVAENMNDSIQLPVRGSHI